MDIVKVTSKGQVTLPAKVRKALGISDQSYLVADEVGGFIVLRKVDVELDEVTARFEARARRDGVTRASLETALRETRRRPGRA